MKTFLYTLFILFFGFHDFAFAEIEIMVWERTIGDYTHRMILPKHAADSYETAIQKYLSAFEAHPKLRQLTDRTLPMDSTQGKKYNFNTIDPKNKVLTALIANWYVDMSTTDNTRVKNNVVNMTAASAFTLVVPVAADIGLTEAESDNFYNQLTEKLDLLLAMGGDDIDPALYGQNITDSFSVNQRRDQSEFKLISLFKKKAKGVFAGVCRGHQTGGVADGHSMHQEVEKVQPGAKQIHGASIDDGGESKTSWHTVQIKQGSFLSRIFSRLQINDKFLVNSYHHQAIEPAADADSLIVAKGPDGIVEALQGRNNLSFSTQFHPEFLHENNPEFVRLGRTLLRNLVNYARYVKRKGALKISCENLL